MRPLPRTQAILEAGMTQQLHLGAQLTVSLRGERVAEIAVGTNRKGGPITVETLMLWLSATKPIAAAALLQLAERGRLAIDDPVVKFIEEFAPNGKDIVTIRHLLTHTAGLRWVDLGWPRTTWPQIIARLCAAKMEREWVPGQKAGYHPFTTWYLLGEIIQRVSGMSFSRYVRQNIFLPLGMSHCWIGMTPAEFQEWEERMVELPNMERDDHRAYRYANRQGATDCIPGANGLGPTRELIRFYEMLLGEGTLDDTTILAPESVAAMTARQRQGMADATFRHRIDWGYGLIINSHCYRQGLHVPYGYGPHASDDTFGHSGSQSSVAFADRPHQLAVALVFNGRPGEDAHQQRVNQTLSALYEDLELVSPS